MRIALLLLVLSAAVAVALPPPLQKRQPALRVYPSQANGAQLGASECSGSATTGSRGEAVTLVRASTTYCTLSDGGTVTLTANQPAVNAQGLLVTPVNGDGGVPTAATLATVAKPAAVTNAEGCIGARACFATGTLPVSVVLGFEYSAIYLQSNTQVRFTDGTTGTSPVTTANLAGRCAYFRGWWHAGSSQKGMSVDGVASAVDTYNGAMTSSLLGIGSYVSGVFQANASVSDVRVDSSRFGCWP